MLLMNKKGKLSVNVEELEGGGSLWDGAMDKDANKLGLGGMVIYSDD